MIRSNLLLGLAGCWCAATLAGCSGSVTGTLDNGRTVVLRTDRSSVMASFQKETATIKANDKTIVVAPTQVLVDGVEVAVLNADAKKIKLCMNGGNASVWADGVKLKNAPN